MKINNKTIIKTFLIALLILLVSCSLELPPRDSSTNITIRNNIFNTTTSGYFDLTMLDNNTYDNTVVNNSFLGNGVYDLFGRNTYCVVGYTRNFYSFSASRPSSGECAPPPTSTITTTTTTSTRSSRTISSAPTFSFADIEKLINKSIAEARGIEGLKVDVTSVSREVNPGESTIAVINIVNNRNETMRIIAEVDPEIAPYIKITPESLVVKGTLVLEPGESVPVKMTITIPIEEEPSVKTGLIRLISDGQESAIAVEIKVPESVALQPKISIKPLSANVNPGEVAKVQVEISNPRRKETEFTVKLQLINTQTGIVAGELSKRYTITEDLVDVIDLQVPDDVALGEYHVKGILNYYIGGTLKEITDSAPISVVKPLIAMIKPFALKKLWIFTVWQIPLMILFFAAIAIAVHEYRVVQERKKKYQFVVMPKELPQPGPRSAYVGYIAETHQRTFFDIDKLTTHTIVAGSTGSGKTVSAMDIVEECLDKGIAVVVFDPTAQWTGFLRKCTNPNMLKYYRKFGLSPTQAKAYNGNIYQVTNAREILDIKRFIKPGEINVILINQLEPEEIDIFVTNTIREIFKMKPEEYPGLRTLIVYDEVHRLLPKYGGSGEGLIQLERGCREFRKWGIGMLLVSQVLSDFVGEIKANINTEIQMRTRDEGDLRRISHKYGEEILKSLVKANVGTGMVENAEWNKGRPYLIEFRPILHEITRLSDKELDEYKKRNDEIEQLKYELEQLKEFNVDVYDIELELNLALSKLKQGNFGMVDVYLEGIRPRIEGYWKQIGKTPKKKEIKLVSEEELKKELEMAKEARRLYIEELRKRARAHAAEAHTAGPSEALAEVEREIEKKEEAKAQEEAPKEEIKEATKIIPPTEITPESLEGYYNRIKEDAERRKDSVALLRLITIPGELKLAKATKKKESLEKIKSRLDEIAARLK